MEEYGNQLGENSGARGSFLYGGGPVLAPPHSSVYARTSSGSNSQQHQNQLPLNSFHLQSSECYEQSEGQNHPTVKTEAGSSHHQHGQKFHYPSIIRGNHHHHHHQTVQDHHHHQQQQDENENKNSGEVDAIKAKIVAHPQYSDLLEAYMDCQKVKLYFNNATVEDFAYFFSNSLFFLYINSGGSSS